MNRATQTKVTPRNLLEKLLTHARKEMEEEEGGGTLSPLVELSWDSGVDGFFFCVEPSLECEGRLCLLLINT